MNLFSIRYHLPHTHTCIAKTVSTFMELYTGAARAHTFYAKCIYVQYTARTHASAHMTRSVILAGIRPPVWCGSNSSRNLISGTTQLLPLYPLCLQTPIIQQFLWHLNCLNIYSNCRHDLEPTLLQHLALTCTTYTHAAQKYEAIHSRA